MRLFRRLGYYKRFLELLWNDRKYATTRQKFRRIMHQLDKEFQF